MDGGRTLSRSAGYAATAALCAAALWAINVEPGWQAWGFLTSATAELITTVNVALVAGLVGSGVVLVRDTTLVRGLRGALSATFALVVLAKLFVVFPFDIPDGSAWRIVALVVLGVLMVAAFIALVTGLGRVARAWHVNAHLRR